MRTSVLSQLHELLRNPEIEDVPPCYPSDIRTPYLVAAHHQHQVTSGAAAVVHAGTHGLPPPYAVVVGGAVYPLAGQLGGGSHQIPVFRPLGQAAGHARAV